jgi:FKBP-type peptidyl-prolyl cis-trans isomerase FklB
MLGLTSSPASLVHGARDRAPARALRRARVRASSRAARGPAPPRAFAETFEVALTRPMGLVLNSGFDETGAYVAEVVAGGNAEAEGTLRVGDVLLSCGARDCDFDVPGSKFDDIMDALGAHPDASVMNLRARRFDAQEGPNKTKPEGYVWLEANAKKEGVTVLPSGLQYKVLQQGTGTRSPKTDTPCACHYSGALIDGTEFDSSYRRGKPSTFAPRQVIKGWTEAMQLMKEGDKWELYVPAELGYGGRGSPSGSIKPGDALVFTIEIVSIQG